ncbi:MAG TPA: hypothetical protein DHW14_00650 [Clostridiales bacterium]|nr:hypothetical protein [Clostridiales bacterium]
MRPVLRIPRTRFEAALDCVGVLALGAMAWVLYVSWPALRPEVPVDFGTSGTPVAWGSKGLLLLFAGVALAVHLGLSLLRRVPHLYNYPFPITEANARRQYLLARTLVTALRTEVVVVFTYIVWQMVRVALGRAQSFGQTGVLFFVALIFATVAAYFIQASKAR